MMTRDQILDAAAQIFREKGFHAASMQDIAAAVNLQKASLYHHVSGKQEILLALLDRALDVLYEQVSPVVLLPAPAAEKLRQMIAVYLQSVTGHADLISVLLMEHRSLDPDLRERHVPNRDRFETLWRQVLNEGVQSGEFICDEVNLAVRGILGILNWTITWYRPDGNMSVEQIADQYAALLLNGLTSNG